MKHDFDPQEPTQRWYTKSKRQCGLQNLFQLEYLHDKFDEVCTHIKKMRQSTIEARNANLNKNLRFLIPYNIIAFCANALIELLDSP